MSQDFGLDRSGNTNHWAVNNITYGDQVLDSPTNNFATWNPLVKEIVGTVVLSEGNLRASASSNSGYTESTIAITSGKYYMEIYCETLATADADGIGFTDLPGGGAGTNDQNSGIYWRSNGSFYVDASIENTYATFETGDIIGMAINADDGAVYFYKNNVLIASRTSLSYDKYLPYLYNRAATSADALVTNFGQDSSFAGNKTAQGNQDGNEIGDFYYTPPTGYLALCTSNLPDVAVTPSEHFSTVLYDGDGNTTGNAITGVGFQPELVWLKMMSAGITHRLYDTVRGVTKGLSTHLTTAEATEDTFVSFDADGFTVKEHASDGSHTNDAGDNFVAWCWNAGSTASGTTTGSGTGKAYSAAYNTDAGFSIITYEGNDTAGHTIPHHLSKAPEWFMIKAREHTDPWCLFHHNLHPSTPEQYADEMNAILSFHDTTYWNDTAPTSSVFTLGSTNNVNGNDVGYIAYCFHSVDGYSKVGTYEGNDNADGTFVYTGFRPAYVWIKNIDASSNWVCHDTTRNTYNPSTKRLLPNLAAGERTDLYGILDFTSNGFKLRDGDNLTNEETYIYFAIAETPFKYANAR